ncbi:hypothetical protein DFP72DRAFT_905846 [Ephemerocybe angulata]|uniref:Uncharacterized protein n=1 Tax=Ephemerocybe angulata TaxID=980116 RepID=A0A8H6HRU6_9AGAR|nr:hypothetical protein DFP72DRAFT_905829 [Tulosesus angulatus]KAF6752019.1 hypothetical protein DFP72DRAFT_905846 [Tulosesus angulatus]
MRPPPVGDRQCLSREYRECKRQVLDAIGRKLLTLALFKVVLRQSKHGHSTQNLANYALLEYCATPRGASGDCLKVARTPPGKPTASPKLWPCVCRCCCSLGWEAVVAIVVANGPRNEQVSAICQNAAIRTHPPVHPSCLRSFGHAAWTIPADSRSEASPPHGGEGYSALTVILDLNTRGITTRTSDLLTQRTPTSLPPIENHPLRLLQVNKRPPPSWKRMKSPTSEPEVLAVDARREYRDLTQPPITTPAAKARARPGPCMRRHRQRVPCCAPSLWR